MIFSYLDLPKVPDEFVNQCMKNIDLIDRDPFLNEKNKKEGISHSITYIPKNVLHWLKTNCMFNLFDGNIPVESFGFMLHVSHYIKDPNFREQNPIGNGTHPIHFDYGRNYAINYVIDTGGDKVVTSWYEEDKKTIIESVEIEPFRWHIIKVKPTYHGVEGIRPGRLRCVISTNWNVPSSGVGVEEYFKNKLIGQ